MKFISCSNAAEVTITFKGLLFHIQQRNELHQLAVSRTEGIVLVCHQFSLQLVQF